MARLNPNLRSFWRTKSRVKVLKGGRMSSKTRDACGMAVYIASQYSLRILCTRQYQAKISESVYAVIVHWIYEFDMQDEFTILKNTITHKTTGSTFIFYGIKLNINEIKGLEGINLCIMEESEGLTREQWAIIEPTIMRNDGAEIVMLYNPHTVGDFIESFKHDPEKGVIVRQINYDENPFLSQTALDTIASLKDSDYDEYEHYYLGVPWNNDDKSIIKRAWLDACVDAHIKLGIEPTGRKRIGFDVADSGADLNSMVYVHGCLAISRESWKGAEDALLESCRKVYSSAIELAADVTYDSIGVGAFCGSMFDDMNDQRLEQAIGQIVDYKKFVAGGKCANPEDDYIEGGQPIANKDYFANSKAQAWVSVADRCRKTYNAIMKGDPIDDEDVISFSSEMDGLHDLITQLSSVYRDFDKLGRYKVESKDDLKKRGIDSPNDADAVIMAYCPQEEDHMETLLGLARQQ